jgi:YidC/Oxa1 family membrane protein insertase
MQELKDEFEKERLVNPAEAQTKYFAGMQRVRAVADFSVFKMATPILLQLAIGLGTFRFLRVLSQTPGLGLTSQGVLWFPDLTVADPYFVLPAVMSASMFAVAKVSFATALCLLFADLS